MSMDEETDYDKELKEFKRRAREIVSFSMKQEYIDSRRDYVEQYNSNVNLAKKSFKYVSYNDRKSKLEDSKLDAEKAQEEFNALKGKRLAVSSKQKKLDSERLAAVKDREQKNLVGRFNLIASDKEKAIARRFQDDAKKGTYEEVKVKELMLNYVLNWFRENGRADIANDYEESIAHVEKDLAVTKAKEDKKLAREKAKEEASKIKSIEKQLEKLEKSAEEEPEAYRQILEMFDGNASKADAFVYEWNKKSIMALDEGYLEDAVEREIRVDDYLHDVRNELRSLNPATESQARKEIASNEWLYNFPTLFSAETEDILETGKQNAKERQRQSRREYEERHPGRKLVKNPKPRIKGGQHTDRTSEFNRDAEGKPHLSEEDLRIRWANNISYSMIVSSERLRSDVERLKRIGGNIKQGSGSQEKRQGKILQMADNLETVARNIQMMDYEELTYFIDNFMLSANKFFDYESLEYNTKGDYYSLTFDHRERSDWKLKPARKEWIAVFKGQTYVKRFSYTGSTSVSHNIMDLMRITTAILARNEESLDLPFYEREENRWGK